MFPLPSLALFLPVIFFPLLDFPVWSCNVLQKGNCPSSLLLLPSWCSHSPPPIFRSPFERCAKQPYSLQIHAVCRSASIHFTGGRWVCEESLTALWDYCFLTGCAQNLALIHSHQFAVGFFLVAAVKYISLLGGQKEQGRGFNHEVIFWKISFVTHYTTSNDMQAKVFTQDPAVSHGVTCVHPAFLLLGWHPVVKGYNERQWL